MRFRLCVLPTLLAALIGAVWADPSGTLLYSNAHLVRDSPIPYIQEQLVPPLPTAACAVARIQGEIVREIGFMAFGPASLHIVGMNVEGGTLLDDGTLSTVVEVLRTGSNALDLTIGPLDPGTAVTLVLIEPFDGTVTRTDPEVVNLLQGGSRLNYAVGNGGVVATRSGSSGARLRAHASLRYQTDVYDAGTGGGAP